MLIKSAAFVTSLSRPGDFPGRGLPEIVVVGKSNVGKSSLINRLTGNGHLARTSGEPGKTRLINIYAVNGLLNLVDLPGYGFARVSREEKQRWAAMIEEYLTGSGHIRMALQLVDLRHPPTEDDASMVAYLRHYGIPFAVAATKADKLSRAARGRAMPIICRELAVQPWDVIAFSSVDGAGREGLLDRIEAATLPAPK
jgi:GTP-binding protein